MMTRYFHVVIFLIGLMSPLTVVAQSNDVKADVAISIQQNQDIWAGQQVTLNLDLKTTGFSFSNSHFNLPEVSGAFLMQTDTTTVKMSERIDGEAWQIVRYPLALYPQKAGQLKVPSINVRFKTSAEFGSTEKAFEFQTEPLDLTIKLPPGVKDGDLVITTTSFELDYDWQPETGAAKTGDAITLTVTRRANDISAMLLPPLPVYRTAGLAAYPQAPEINDKTNRGDLTGERIDSIIWVVEEPGLYNIPGIRFQWWDPNSHELKQQIIPGLSLDIVSSTRGQIVAETDEGSELLSKGFIWLLLAIFMVSAAIFLWPGIGRKSSGQAVDSEKSTFAALQKACRSNHPGQTHSALHEWIDWSAPVVPPDSRSMTLSEFAHANDDARLTTEFKQLEEALISSDSNWRGDGLLRSLLHVRSKINSQKVVQLKTYLAPLNP
jgi:hypothetical protein